MKTGLEDLRDKMKSGISALDEFPDIAFKRGYESCTDVILIKIDQLIKEEQTPVSDPWISVETDKPKEDFYVLCRTDQNGVVRNYVLAISFHTNQWYDWEGHPFNGEITHYQELPTPPQTK